MRITTEQCAKVRSKKSQVSGQKVPVTTGGHFFNSRCLLLYCKVKSEQISFRAIPNHRWNNGCRVDDEKLISGLISVNLPEHFE